MKAKKSEKANLENKRGLYFQLGLIISLSLTLTAFEWSSTDRLVNYVKGNLSEEPIYVMDFVEPQQKKEQSSSQPKNKAQKPSTKIEVVEKQKSEPNKADTSFIEDFKIGDEGDTKPVIENITFTDPNKKYEGHQVTKSPNFPGGEAAIREFINANIRVPQITIDKGVPVKIYLSFVVNSKGKVVDVEFKDGKASPQLKKEAIRVISKLPDWEPAEKNGIPVSVIQYIPINVVIK